MQCEKYSGKRVNKGISRLVPLILFTTVAIFSQGCASPQGQGPGLTANDWVRGLNQLNNSMNAQDRATAERNYNPQRLPSHYTPRATVPAANPYACVYNPNQCGGTR